MSWDGEPDLENRDPNNLNDHIKVSWEEKFGEPESTRSMACVWRYSYKCFNLWKNLCYVIATTLCGIPLAMCWGCTFACIAFCHIWQITPCVGCYEMNLKVCQRFYGAYIHCMYDPLCESFALCWSAFKKSG